MARVKRAVGSKKHRKQVLERAKGYYGNKSRSFRAANEQVMQQRAVRVPRPPGQEGRVPSPVDPADQRRLPPERHQLQPVHRRPERRRHRGRPQGPGRPGRHRPGGVRRARDRGRQGGSLSDPDTPLTLLEPTGPTTAAPPGAPQFALRGGCVRRRGPGAASPRRSPPAGRSRSCSSRPAPSRSTSTCRYARSWRPNVHRAGRLHRVAAAGARRRARCAPAVADRPTPTFVLVADRARRSRQRRHHHPLGRGRRRRRGRAHAGLGRLRTTRRSCGPAAGVAVPRARGRRRDARRVASPALPAARHVVAPRRRAYTDADLPGRGRGRRRQRGPRARRRRADRRVDHDPARRPRPRASTWRWPRRSLASKWLASGSTV